MFITAIKRVILLLCSQVFHLLLSSNRISAFETSLLKDTRHATTVYNGFTIKRNHVIDKLTDIEVIATVIKMSIDSEIAVKCPVFRFNSFWN